MARWLHNKPIAVANRFFSRRLPNIVIDKNQTQTGAQEFHPKWSMAPCNKSSCAAILIVIYFFFFK